MNTLDNFPKPSKKPLQAKRTIFIELFVARIEGN